jgi:hypothetical protein
LLILLPRIILLPLAILSLIFEKNLLALQASYCFGLPSLLAPVLALYAYHVHVILKLLCLGAGPN